jgi:hypothetical protein
MSHDAKRGCTVRVNLDSEKNFLGYHTTVKIKCNPYGQQKPGSIHFGNSGVENIIPFLMEVDQMGEWA